MPNWQISRNAPLPERCYFLDWLAPPPSTSILETGLRVGPCTKSANFSFSDFEFWICWFYFISKFWFYETNVKTSTPPGPIYIYTLHTVWCNQMGTVFSNMSSWTALTKDLGVQKTFQSKYIKANMFGLLLWWFQFFITLYENSSTKTQFMSSLLLCAVFLWICIFFKLKIFIISIPSYLLFILLV